MGRTIIKFACRGSDTGRKVGRRLLAAAIKVGCVLCAPGFFDFAASFVQADLIFVSGFGSSGVNRYDSSTGAFTNLVAPGTAGLTEAQGIGIGPDGQLYVASFGSNQVLRFSSTTGAFLGVVGDMSSPNDLLFHNGILYVDSFYGDSIERFDPITSAYIDTFATVGNAPHGLAFGPNGNLFVSSFYGNQILEYDGTTGAFDKVFAAGGGLNAPTGLTFGPNGDLYVSSYGTNSVLEYNGTTGDYVGTFVSSGSGGMSGPNGVLFGPDGDLYVGGYLSNNIVEYDGMTGAPVGAIASDAGISGDTYFTFSGTAVPEPGSLTLWCLGLASLGGMGWLTMRKASPKYRRSCRTVSFLPACVDRIVPESLRVAMPGRLVLSLALIALAASQASAGYVYNLVNYPTAQNGYTLSGTITTTINSGTLGYDLPYPYVSPYISAFEFTITNASNQIVDSGSWSSGQAFNNPTFPPYGPDFVFGIVDISPTAITVPDQYTSAGYSPAGYNVLSLYDVGGPFGAGYNILNYARGFGAQDVDQYGVYDLHLWRAAADPGALTALESPGDVWTVATAAPTVTPEPSTLVMSAILLAMFGLNWSYKRLNGTATAR